MAAVERLAGWLLRVESSHLPLHLLVREGMGYYDEQARCLWIVYVATARRGLFSQGSHVAPSPERSIPCKQHDAELTYWSVYGFKPRATCTKGLTPAIFCNTRLFALFFHLLGARRRYLQTVAQY